LSGSCAARVRELAHAVLEWGDANRRAFPWRTTRDPWLILVSEVMLQQTQTSRVVDRYRDWAARFETPQACVDAGLAEVLRSWTGLGYNRRARDLYRAASIIVERHGGRVPADLAALRALPGVGDYTARAVMSFAFGTDTGAVDSNVRRILCRAVAGRPLRPSEAQALADRLVPRGRSWEHNQAMFDIGSLYCRARMPRCSGCPLRPHCVWAGGRNPGPPTPGQGRPSPAHPDPARPMRPRAAQRFEGSDRQGRGRLIATLCQRTVDAWELGQVAGWPDDPNRAMRNAEALVAEGLAMWVGEATLALANGRGEGQR